MKQKVAVTGAFSYSGKYIAHRLLARGEEVITLTNHPNRPDPFEGKIKAYPLNFMNESELTKNLEGIDTLYNTYYKAAGTSRGKSGCEAHCTHQYHKSICRFEFAVFWGKGGQRKSRN
jgi:putative NADH-flavin reductase